jgi:hypothetical protein
VDYALTTRFSSCRLPKDLLQILHRNNQAILYSLKPVNFSMRVYMWKNHLFAARQSIKLGDCNKTSLLCLLVHLGGNRAKVCIDKKCIFRTVMPLSKYCCIKISSADLDCVKITHLGHLMHLPKTKKTVRFLNATNASKNMRPLTLSNSIIDLKTPAQAIPPLADPNYSSVLDRTREFISEVHMGGPEPIMCDHMICHTDGSLLSDGNKSFCSASVFFNALDPQQSTSLSVALPDGPASSFRCKLWGVILACASVKDNTHLLVLLDGQSVV